ncbi:MAG: hypothetical protein E5X44_17210 [Mesorhizobium sp.]|nr:MAG: hypothetical protein E5X44_17210 [Mesorhizobium sp.]
MTVLLAASLRHPGAKQGAKRRGAHAVPSVKGLQRVKEQKQFSSVHYPGFCTVVTPRGYGMDPWVFAPLRVAAPKDDEVARSAQFFFDDTRNASGALKIAC